MDLAKHILKTTLKNYDVTYSYCLTGDFILDYCRLGVCENRNKELKDEQVPCLASYFYYMKKMLK